MGRPFVIYEDRVCKFCEKTFQKKKNTPKCVWLKKVYCNKECMTRDYNKNKVKITCIVCGVDKEKPLSQSAYKYCSLKCYHTSNAGKRRPNHGLKMQGNNFNLGKKLSEKQREKITGKNHWRYGKGKNINELKARIRLLAEYKEWRLCVYKRDKFTCQICNKTNVRLECHHIKSFSSILNRNNIHTITGAIYCSELWEISNGKTLCKQCHKKTDSYGKKYKDQYSPVVYK